MKILLIEDDDIAAGLIRRRLEKAGHTIRREANGLCGLESARAFRPVLILLDLALPLVNGFDICRMARQDAQLKSIPIFVLSSRRKADDVRRAMEVGANDYICKAFVKDDLADIIYRKYSGLAQNDFSYYFYMAAGPH